MFANFDHSLEQLLIFPLTNILFRLAILFLGRSGGYYYEKASGREEAPRSTLAGDGGWLNLTRAVGKLQRWQAHQIDA